MDNLNNLGTIVNRKADESERGATMVEYAIMVALIAVVSIAAVRLLGTNLNTTFNSVANSVGNTTP